MRHRGRRNGASKRGASESIQQRLAEKHGVAVTDVRYREIRTPRSDGSSAIETAWEIRKGGTWEQLHWTETQF
ncbi:MAG: hypothetical protein AAF394_18830 [Planctomycetota bacterium]